jgi:broad specificity phosphatase PhoE
MSNVYFIRHAKAENPNRHVGHDGGISVEGKRELAQLGNFFVDKTVQVIYHSPLKRTTDTALTIASSKPEILVADSRLRERMWGKEDATWEEIEQTLSRMSLMDRYEYKPEGGESWQEFEQRTADFWNDKIRSTSDEIAIVSHEGTMRCLLSFLLRPAIGGLVQSLNWSINQSFAQGSVSVFDRRTEELKKEVFVPKLDTE